MPHAGRRDGHKASGQWHRLTFVLSLDDAAFVKACIRKCLAQYGKGLTKNQKMISSNVLVFFAVEWAAAHGFPTEELIDGEKQRLMSIDASHSSFDPTKQRSPGASAVRQSSQVRQ